KNSTRLFEVEYIVDFKMINGQRYYLIKWVGWPNEANTWEPDDNLSCSHLIHDFHEDYTMQLYKNKHEYYASKQPPKVIKNEEAERRGKRYDSEGMTYLFDLDYYDSENPLTVDATRFGNISHFVNHSCSPNLQVYNVFINNVDPSLPRIALFALRTISANEELTFDYQMTGDNSPDADKHSLIKRTRCLCGSSSCRGWLV
uniref:Uncharacterized protein n=1 Tax=Ciona savignyi TaxID=51511 RepID=H2YGM6_CIOSA